MTATDQPVPVDPQAAEDALTQLADWANTGDDERDDEVARLFSVLSLELSRVVRLRAEVEAATRERDEYRQRFTNQMQAATELIATLEAAEATLGRVKALCDEWNMDGTVPRHLVSAALGGVVPDQPRQPEVARPLGCDRIDYHADHDWRTPAGVLVHCYGCANPSAAVPVQPTEANLESTGASFKDQPETLNEDEHEPHPHACNCTPRLNGEHRWWCAVNCEIEPSAAVQPNPEPDEQPNGGSCKHGQTMFCTDCFTEAITPPAAVYPSTDKPKDGTDA